MSIALQLDAKEPFPIQLREPQSLSTATPTRALSTSHAGEEAQCRNKTHKIAYHKREAQVKTNTSKRGNRQKKEIAKSFRYIQNMPQAPHKVPDHKRLGSNSSTGIGGPVLVPAKCH
jgi:hypothetical protein